MKSKNEKFVKTALTNVLNAISVNRIGILEFIALSIGSVFLLNQVFELIFAPNLFMDEGYYLGATHQVLNGDLFLRNYSFDKPFLLALWPLPGVLLFGENPFGFHFIPTLGFIGAFVLFYKTATTLGSKRVSAFFLSLLLFSLPSLQSLSISNFCEPYILFLTTLILYLVVKKAPLRWISNVFFLGFFTKYSFLSVLPFVLASSALNAGEISLRWIFRYAKEFILAGKYLLFLGLIYLFLNQVPFKSITWFSVFSTYSTNAPSLSTRFVNWFSLFGEQFTSKPLWLTLLLAIFVGTVASMMKSEKRSYSSLSLLWIAILPAFLILPISAAPLLGRYLLIVLILFFLLLAHLIGRSNVITISIAFCGLLALYPVKRSPIDSNIVSARNAYEIRNELNRNNVILQDDSLWVTSLFRDRVISSGCTSKKCSDEFQKGTKSQHFQYVFEKSQLSRILPDQVMIKDRQIDSGLSPDDIALGLLGSMRLKKSVKIEDVSFTDSDTAKIPLLYDGSIVKIGVSVEKGLPLFVNHGDRAEISAQLWIHDLHDYPARFNQPRFQLMARFLSFKVKDREIIDFVMPYFFKGYSVPISNLAPVWDENKWLLSPHFRDGHIQLREVIFKERS
jgi:hypothetical protein